MSEKKISFRDEFKQNNLHKKEERAKKDFNRNVLGLDISALVFLGMLLMTLRGVRFGGNLSMVAKSLEISRPTLYAKLKKYNI